MEQELCTHCINLSLSFKTFYLLIKMCPPDVIWFVKKTILNICDSECGEMCFLKSRVCIFSVIIAPMEDLSFCSDKQKTYHI